MEIGSIASKIFFYGIGVAVFAAGTLEPQRVEACSCNLQTGLVEPTGSTIPVNGRFIITARQTGIPPRIELRYTDDPTRALIPGTLTALGSLSFKEVWVYTATASFTPGRSIRAAIFEQNMMTAVHEVLVDTASAAASPFTGVTEARAIRSHLRSMGSGADCNPQNGAVQNRLELPRLPPLDARTPIYRYYFYETPGDMPLTPSVVGVRGWFLSSMRCGNAELLCEPWTPLFLQPGRSFCVRVEGEDLAGNRTGYSSEACTTVAEEEVQYQSQSGLPVFGFCVPLGNEGPDGGVADDAGGVLGPDSGIGTGNGGGGDSGGGCSCTSSPFAATFDATSLLLLSLLCARARSWQRRARDRRAPR